LGPFVGLGLLIRVADPEIMTTLWVGIVCRNGLPSVPMFLTWESVALEREGEPEIMTAVWVEIVSGSGVVWGARLPSVAEVIDDEMIPGNKRKPLVVGNISVDGEERGPGGVVGEGEERTPPSDDELPLSDKGLLEPEGGLALLLPSEREEPIGEGESVEGEELSSIEFGLVGLCEGAGEG
jgi:hypothetical protein